MTRDEFKLRSEKLEKSEFRLLLLPVFAFAVPVAAFVISYKHIGSWPQTRLIFGGLSLTCWLLFIPVMLRLYDSRARELGLICPGCGKRLAGFNRMIVMSTTRCGVCGHQIIT